MCIKATINKYTKINNVWANGVINIINVTEIFDRIVNLSTYKIIHSSLINYHTLPAEYTIIILSFSIEIIIAVITEIEYNSIKLKQIKEKQLR